MAALVLAARSWFASVGEPVADDFDYLHDAMISGGGGWLDGGGAQFYWRPVARQLYFRALGPTMLAHPAWIAALHVALLAATAWLLYRVLRRVWAGPWAAAAATFPLIMDAARPLVSWPSNFQDLGAILFSALALHEASRARMATALGSLLGALLCKETAVVTALLLPWMPGSAPAAPRARLGRTAAVFALVGAWAVAYWAVVRNAGPLLARDPTGGGQGAMPWAGRWAWAVAHAFRDALGWTAVAPALERWLALGFAGLLVTSAVVALRDGGARRRLRLAAPWLAWGAAWFALAAAMAAEFHPDWRPYRGVFGSIGLGIAMAAVLAAIRPVLIGALVALRLVAFALAPAPSAAVEATAPDGFSLDFARLTRLQRLMDETRRELTAAIPGPASGARVAGHYFPVAVLWAYNGDKSFQVWYRDTSVHWVALRESGPRPTHVLEFQPTPPRQVVAIAEEAMRHLQAAVRHLEREEWNAALAEAARAESLEHDPGARVFASMVAGKRAMALGGLGAGAAAESSAARALALWQWNDDARFVLAIEWKRRGLWREAERMLDTLIRSHPGDDVLLEMRAEVRRALSR